MTNEFPLEIEIAGKELQFINCEIEQDEALLDIIADRLEKNRLRRDAKVAKINELALFDPIEFPTIIKFEIEEATR